ncbi:MAG: SDR family NAD(P)-dependent oxidoreductase [Chromatocurvus sp.]
MKNLEGRIILVTGAAGGIGMASCERLLREGACLVATDLDTAPLDRLACADLETLRGDITAPDLVDRCVARALARYGRLDAAFLNAGIECQAAPLADTPDSEFDRVFAVNVRSVFTSARALVRHFQQAGSGGNLLFMSSIAGLRGSATTAVYNASKHAVIGLAKSLALEVGAQGIRTNVLCPGTVNTRMMRSLESTIGAAMAVDAETVRMQMVGASALGRYAEVEEIAALAAWLLSDEAAYCHGEVFTIGGGMMASA